MSVQTIQMKPVVPVALVLKLVKAPMKIPAWSVVFLLIMAGAYGYVSGRQNPVHHYVPYVGYPLVLDTTTGKACYSSQPKAPADGSPLDAALPPDSGANRMDADVNNGPSIPLCERK